MILLNPSLETINVPRATIVGNLTPVDVSDFAPSKQVLQINSVTSRSQITDISHLAKYQTESPSFAV